MKEENSFKKQLIEMTFKLIDNNKDQSLNCKDIIKEIFQVEYISIYTIDIVSCLIGYIKEHIFKKYLRNVFEILEDNNILTTLLEIRRNKYDFITQDVIQEIVYKYLEGQMKLKNINYKPKFCYNYNIPGFYNFYNSISDYIKKNIAINYLNNENKLRKVTKTDIDINEKIDIFHRMEESLLNNVLNEIKKNYIFFYEIMNKIPNPNKLIFNDYITFYLKKYANPCGFYKRDDIYHKIIELLIYLRYNEEENNKFKGMNQINILLIKIIWIESNLVYILKILNILENSLIIYNNDPNNFYNKLEKSILNDKNIIYITNEKKNPEYTKEINECFYIVLANICYSLTSDDIVLIEMADNKRKNGIEIDHYLSQLKEVNNLLSYLNDNLHLYLYEMYIIDELIKIMELFKKNNNIEKINKIKNQIRANTFLIQKYANINNELLYEELCDSFDKTYNLIIKDEVIKNNDKDKLKYILFKEMKKISNNNYRYKILEKVLEDDDIIKISNDIFQIILKKYLKKDKYGNSLTNLVNEDKDITIKFIENKLNDNNYDNFILSETLLYLFEKNSLVYFQNILRTKNINLDNDDDNKEDKNKDQNQGPLKI